MGYRIYRYSARVCCTWHRTCLVLLEGYDRAELLNAGLVASEVFSFVCCIIRKIAYSFLQVPDLPLVHVCDLEKSIARLLKKFEFPHQLLVVFLTAASC